MPKVTQLETEPGFKPETPEPVLIITIHPCQSRVLLQGQGIQRGCPGCSSQLPILGKTSEMNQ